MTEETRRAPVGQGPGRSAARRDEAAAAHDFGAERDMRDILASIRKLMKETPTPEPGALPEARRREERARRFETVAAPPRAPVDDWPDDPEIDVDALAEELLRMAGSLAERRAAALGGKAQEDMVPAPPPAPAGAPQEAWGELDALLSYAEQAFEAGVLEDDTAHADAALADAVSEGPQTPSAGDLVAYPTPEHSDPAEPMPDLSDVLRNASELNPAAPPTPPDAPAPAPAPDSADAPSTVPAPPPSEGLAAVATGEESKRQGAELPSGVGPASAAPIEARRSPAAPPVAEASPPVEETDLDPVSRQTTASSTPEISSQPLQVATPVASAMPDDPRNGPSNSNVNTLQKIGEMVRAQAQENLLKGVTTYSGRDPHPRIVEKTGWSRQPKRSAPPPEQPAPPATPTELALKALEQDDAPDAVEPALPTPTGDDPTQTLRTVLADWLDQNLSRLMEEMVKEQMSRLSKEDGSEPR